MPRVKDHVKRKRENGMEGGRPTIPITLCGNCDESSNNDGLFKQFVSSINVDYRDYNKIVIEDEDDDFIFIEENSIDYESDLCNKFVSMMLTINANNELLFPVNEDNIFNGVTSNFGIRKGCGNSRATEYRTMKKSTDLANSAAGSKVIEAYFKPIDNIDEYNTDDDMNLANGDIDEGDKNNNYDEIIKSEKTKIKECIEKLIQNEGKVTRKVSI
jgi:hypothetical protein